MAARLSLAALSIATVFILQSRLAWPLSALLVIAAWRPKIGVFLWIGVAGTLLVPIYTVRSSAVFVSTAYLAFLCGLYGLDWLTGVFIPSRRSPLLLPLIALAGAAVLSLVQSFFFYDESVPAAHRFFLAQLYATALVLASVAAALMVGTVLSGWRDIRTAVLILVAISAFVLGIHIPSGIGWPLAHWWPALATNGVALLTAGLLFGVPGALWQRSLAAGLVLYGLADIVVIPFAHASGSQWVSGWILMVVPVGVALLLRAWKTTATGAVAAAAGLVYMRWNWIEYSINRAAEEGDFGRVQIWQDTFRIFLKRPVLGVGPGNYPDYSATMATGYPISSAHGNYQQVAAEMGAVGLLALLWVLLTAAWMGLRRFRGSADPQVRALTAGLVAALCGHALAAVVGDYLIPAYHNGGHTTICTTIYVWVLIGLLIAVERLPSNPAAAPPG
jgi:O-antigen ligase